jgi:hypothetical protein
VSEQVPAKNIGSKTVCFCASGLSSQKLRGEKGQPSRGQIVSTSFFGFADVSSKAHELKQVRGRVSNEWGRAERIDLSDEIAVSHSRSFRIVTRVRATSMGSEIETLNFKKLDPLSPGG